MKIIKCSGSSLKSYEDRKKIYQNIKSLYEFFVSFGYATEQILKMTIERPQIFCFNLEIIKHFSDKNVDMDK